MCVGQWEWPDGDFAVGDLQDNVPKPMNAGLENGDLGDNVPKTVTDRNPLGSCSLSPQKCWRKMIRSNEICWKIERYPIRYDARCGTSELCYIVNLYIQRLIIIWLNRWKHTICVPTYGSHIFAPGQYLARLTILFTKHIYLPRIQILWFSLTSTR